MPRAHAPCPLQICHCKACHGSSQNLRQSLPHWCSPEHPSSTYLSSAASLSHTLCVTSAHSQAGCQAQLGASIAFIPPCVCLVLQAALPFLWRCVVLPCQHQTLVQQWLARHRRDTTQPLHRVPHHQQHHPSLRPWTWSEWLA